MSFAHRVLQQIMARVTQLVCARPLLILVVGASLALLSIFVVVTRFNVVNNTSDLLSDRSQQKQDYNELLKNFGSDSRFIILIRSPDAVKNRASAEAVGQFLETLKPQISQVLYKIDFSAVKKRLLFTRDPADLKKIAAQVESDVAQQKATDQANGQIALGLNSILSEANAKFSDSYLREKSNWKDFKPFVARFITILDKISNQASGEKKPPSASNATGNDTTGNLDADEEIAKHEYFSFQDGKAILVFGYPGQEEPDSDSPFSHTVAKIRAKLLELQSQSPGLSLQLTGEPALDADQIAAANADTAKASGITLALILTLFALSYRAFLRPTFVFGVLIMAVLWALGFALLTVGHFNVLSVAVIPMVLGIGIDFGIQILGRYEEELGHGRSVVEAIDTALRHTGVAIITGGSTTAAAFFTLCFNDFIGLSELGIIAGASMILCLIANLVVLPAVFLLRDRHRSAEQLRTQSSNSSWRFMQNWDQTLVRTPRLWLTLSFFISIAAAVSLPYLSFDYNLLHLQNQAAPSVQVLHEVMDVSKTDSGNEVSTIYASVVADNLDQARDLSRKLSAVPEVARVDSLLDLVPADQEAKLPLVRQIVKAAAQLNVRTDNSTQVDIPKARSDVASLLSQAAEGRKQAQGYVGVSSIAKDAVKAFGDMLPALTRAQQALNSASTATLEQRFAPNSGGEFSNLQKNIELLKAQKGDRGLTLQDAPPQLKRLFLAPNGQQILLQVYGKKDLWERSPDAEFTQAVLKVAPHATGTPVLNYYATDLLRLSYLWAAVWAFVAIVVLIFLHFQSIKFLLLTITPLLLAVLWRTGAMVWFGISFNPANIVTLPLIIGIDVAFGVYIIDRYRENGRLSVFAGSTGKAIVMSSFTSLFGFSSLLVSQFRGMFDIGQLMSLGIAIGLVTSIFILPQLLSLLKPIAPENPQPDA